MLQTRQLIAQGTAHQVWPPACQGHQQLCQSDTKADSDQPHTVLPGSTSCHYGKVVLVKLATSSCANQIQRRILANIKLCFPEAPVAIMEMCCLRSWPTRNYTWPGSSWRPSACWADVIATRPQVPTFSGEPATTPPPFRQKERANLFARFALPKCRI